MALFPPDPPARPPTRTDHVLVGAAATAAAVGAVLAPGSATGWAPADAVWQAGFAVLVVLAGAKARRWTWLAAAGIATLAAPDLLTALPAALALGLALVTVAFGRRTRVAGAVVLALAVQTLLRLELADPHGLAGLVTLAATGPALVSAYRRSRRGTRQVVRVAVGTGLAVAAALTILQALAVLDARDDVNRAITAARTGFDAAREGDEAAAVTAFDDAATAFAAADDSLSTPWARAGRAVPLLGQHARAVAEVTASGEALAATAASATADAPIAELQFTDGVLDLEQVAAFRDPLARAEAALLDAEATVEAVDSGWLVPPLADRVDEFAGEVGEALPQAELAAQGVEVAPALFGGDELRRYFVAFVTPAEQRALGGFLGNYGILNAEGGDVTLVRSEEITALRDRIPPDTEITEPVDYARRYGRFGPARSPGDVTVSPDLPSTAQAIEELFLASGGQPLDGVILVDPYALQALLNFTGPITVSGYDTPLTADNAADILLRDQYLTFDERATRKDFLEEASRRTFEALTSGDLPGPRDVGDVLGPMVDQGRLLVTSNHPEEQAFFEALGLDGSFPAAEGGDLLALTTQNSTHNKGDIFLTREIDYRAEVDPATGLVEATATVTLVNDAPASGLPEVVIGVNQTEGTPYFPTDLPPGTNRMYLSLYSPLVLQSASQGGTDLAVESGRELGVNVYSRYVAVPPGGRVTLTFRLLGGIDLTDGYRLVVAGQPTVNPDRVHVAAGVPDGWAIEAERGFEDTGAEVSASWEGPEDRVLSASLAED